jgi:HlyD family secretion protein
MLAKHIAAGILITGLMGCAGDETANVSSNAQNNNDSQRNGLVAPAEIVSLQQITIGPPNVRNMWQFKIEYIANENSLVKKGDTILRFDGQRIRVQRLNG